MPPDVFPFDPQLSETEIALRADHAAPAPASWASPSRSRTPPPRSRRSIFDLIARSADTNAVNGKPMTIQWRFYDADPWYVASTTAPPAPTRARRRFPT